MNIDKWCVVVLCAVIILAMSPLSWKFFPIKKCLIDFDFLLFYLAMPQIMWDFSMWDPSSQTRDQTHTPSIESAVLTTGPPVKSL